MASGLGGTLRARLRRLQEPVVVLSAAACLLVLVLLPLLAVAGELLDADGPRALVAALGSVRPWLLLAQTIALAGAITTLALLIGVPLGVLLGETDVVGRRLALLVHAFPLFLPPFLIGLGWFHVFGRGGALGSELTSTLLFSPLGVVAILGTVFSPVVTGLTVLALRGIEPSLTEAAQMVALPGRVVRCILLPLARPAIAFSALVVFALSVSEVGVPMFLRVRTYSAAVFSRLGGVAYAPGEAFALALPVLALALLLLAIERRYIGRRAFASLGRRSGELRVFRLGRHRTWVSALVWGLCGLSLAPIGALLAVAGRMGLSSLGRAAIESAGTSLLIALASATVITVLGVVVGTRVARSRPGAAWLEAAAMLAFITPASVLGVGLMATWNHPATHLVYGSAAILIVGLVARYVVLGVRGVAVVISGTSTSYEEAARAFGGGYLRRMSRVVAPMHKRGIAAAWLLALVFCLRDLETVVLLYPPGHQTLPVRIFTLEANGAEPLVAALALMHVALTAAALVLGAGLLQKGRAT